MSDMLHDPLVKTMLRADRVSLADFAQMLDEAARRLAASRCRTATPALSLPLREEDEMER